MEKLFSPKLYKAGLRIIKKPSIYLYICFLIYNLDYATTHRLSVKAPFSTPLEFTPMPYLVHILGAFLTYYLFSNSAQKGKTDFFESIPKKKLCVLLSFGASVLTVVSVFVASGAYIISLILSFDTVETHTVLFPLWRTAEQTLFAIPIIAISILVISLLKDKLNPFSFSVSVFSLLFFSVFIERSLVYLLKEIIPSILENKNYISTDKKYTDWLLKYSGLTNYIYFFFKGMCQFSIQSILLSLIFVPFSIRFFSKKKKSTSPSTAFLVFISIIISFVITASTYIIVGEKRIEIINIDSVIWCLSPILFFVLCLYFTKNIKKSFCLLPFSAISIALFQVFVFSLAFVLWVFF